MNATPPRNGLPARFSDMATGSDDVGRPPSREVATHCPYCALQCGMTLREDGGRVRVEARQFPTNQGGLCQKGWTAADLLDHAERLATPLVRDGKDEPLRPATWEEALDRVVSAIVRIQSTHGRDAVAVFGGGGLTNEKAYALGKFARVALRTKHIDYNGRFCMSSAAAAGIRSFGVDRGLPFPIDDVGRADTLLLVGANVAETMPPFTRYLVRTEAARRHADRGRPEGDGHGPPGGSAPAADPGDRPRAGERAAPHRAGRGLG